MSDLRDAIYDAIEDPFLIGLLGEDRYRAVDEFLRIISEHAELRPELIVVLGGTQVGWRDPSGMLWVTTTPGGPKRDERPVFVFPEDQP
jgi:hypothetical protein